jgi:hypothetical protein
MARRTDNVRSKAERATDVKHTSSDAAVDSAVSVPLSHDLLRGADEIAEFLFGDRKHRRRVYHLINDAKVGPPHFRLGAIICARKSSLLRWIAEQEHKAVSALINVGDIPVQERASTATPSLHRRRRDDDLW